MRQGAPSPPIPLGVLRATPYDVGCAPLLAAAGCPVRRWLRASPANQPSTSAPISLTIVLGIRPPLASPPPTPPGGLA